LTQEEMDSLVVAFDEIDSNHGQFCYFIWYCLDGFVFYVYCI